MLLVEDDPDRIRLSEHAIETASAKCELEAVETGRDALARLDEGSPAAFDLVLLDLDLPDVSGHEVCAEIRSQVAPSEVPVVVLTSSEEEDDVRASYEAGANSHVAKAVDYQTFREDLAGILSYWLDVNQTVPSSTL